MKADVNYQFRGGLEPGESADWRLAPNMFSEWGQVESQPDMVLTVEAVKLNGPDEKILYDASFSEEEKERLQALREQYPE